MLSYLIALALIFVPLYPKFPLAEVSGSFVSIRLEDIVLAGIYLIWGVWAIRSKLWLLITKTQRAIILYWIIGFVSVFSGIFLTKTVTPSLGFLHSLRRIEYMGMFFVAYSLLNNIKQLKFFASTLLIVSVIVALFGLGQQFFNFPVISTNNSEFSKGLALTLGPGARINSTFAGHYDLAAFSLFPILIILGLLTLPGRQRLLLIPLEMVCYWAMLLSASRVTFVALIFSASLLVILLRKPKWIMVIILAGVVGLLVSPELSGRYGEFIKNGLKISMVSSAQAAESDIPDALQAPAVPEDRSLSIRLNASWPRSLRAVEKNPILGTGFSSIGLAADNDYLRSLAETGILGTLAFGLVFLRVLKSFRNTALHPKHQFKDVFILAVGCAVLALLVNAIFIDIFEASKVAILSWILMGLAQKATEIS